MAERPIIFSAAMVRALLREVEAPGTGKTMTRRLAWQDCRYCEAAGVVVGGNNPGITCPKCKGDKRRPTPWQSVKPGDRLWVRESCHAKRQHPYACAVWAYSADDALADGPTAWTHGERLYCPSIHMPRRYSRLTLLVTATRMEPLQAISEDDARAEGLSAITKDGRLVKYGIPDRDGWPGSDNDGWPWRDWEADPRKAYARLWDHLHGDGAWERNPEIVAPTFKPVLANTDASKER